MSRSMNTSRRNSGSSRIKSLSTLPCSTLTIGRVAALATARPCDDAWDSRRTDDLLSDVSGGTYLEWRRIVTTVTGSRQEICRRSEIRIIGNPQCGERHGGRDLCRALRLSARCRFVAVLRDVSRTRTCP